MDAARSLDPKLLRLVSLLAAIVGLFLAVSLPAAWLLSNHAQTRASIEAEAKLAATSITQLAAGNPQLWIFEEARIRGLLSLLGEMSEPEQWLVVASSGRVVAQQGQQPPLPMISVSARIYESGTIVGHVEVRRSERDLLLSSALVGIAASVLGGVSFLLLRMLPLRLLRRASAETAHLVTHDALTDLPNRMLFQDRLKQAVAWSRREGMSAAVFYLDLDDFKRVNDTLGHGTGDRLLIEVGSRLRACLRETDTLARLGGDEFAIIQMSVHHPADTERLAQRILETISACFDIDGHSITSGASIGVAVRSDAALAFLADDPAALLQEAEIAQYRAKEAGGGIYRFFDAEMNVSLSQRRTLEQDMRMALERGEFRLEYQPQIDLANDRICGAEALIRWRHPSRGNVPPGEFIPEAERSGLIWQIGAWVLEEACRQAAQWPQLECMAINISPVQFWRPGFIDLVQHTLAEAGVDPRRIELEITEGVLMTDTSETLGILGRLREMGISIAMDDFGTGFSSLGYLQKFRFDKIKIDRSFVRDLGRNPQAGEIVRAVLRMSHALGMRVNAEGVEQQYQLMALQDEGCEEVQGFLFGPAVGPEEFFSRLSQPAAASVRAQVPH